jgi:hypothetical protein
MKSRNNPPKSRYTKPKVVSKVVQFMTNTFTGAFMYGPHREAPERPTGDR